MELDVLKSKLQKLYAEHKKSYSTHYYMHNNYECLTFTQLNDLNARRDFLIFNIQTKKYDSFYIETNKPEKLGEYTDSILNERKPKDSPYFKPLSARESIDLFGLLNDEVKSAKIGTDKFAFSLFKEIGEDVLKNRIDLDALLVQEENRLKRPFKNVFKPNLNQEALNSLGINDFSWRNLDYYSENGEKGKIRRQTASIYPMFATLIASDRYLARTVDSMGSINQALAKYFNVSEKLIKRFQNKNWNLNGVESHVLVSALSELPIDWFPKNEDDWNSFSILTKTLGTYMKGALKGTVENPIEKLYKSSKGDWLEFHKRCALSYVDTRPPEGTTEEDELKFKKDIDWKLIEKSASLSNKDEYIDLIKNELNRVGVPDHIDFNEAVNWIYSMHVPDLSEYYLNNICHDTNEMIQFIADHVCLPAACNRAAEEFADVYIGPNQEELGRKTAAKILFAPSDSGTLVANKIINIVRHFNSQLPQIIEKMLPDGSRTLAEAFDGIANDGWPPLTNSVQTPNGVVAVPLTDPRALKDEGDNMNHCVAGYSNKCRERHYNIVAFRLLDDEGKIIRRLGTLEIEPVEENQKEMKIVQYRGPRNSKPEELAEEAKDWYLHAIRTDQIALNIDQIMKFRRVNGMSKKDEIEQRCEYDWKDKDNITNAMFSVGRYVHKEVTKDVRNVNDLINHTNMQDLLYDISPRLINCP